jgi:hypothetical protein
MRLEFDEAGLVKFNSTRANLGPAMAHLQQAHPSPETEAALAYLWVATTLVEEKSVASKSAASPSSRHSHSRDTCAQQTAPPIQEEVDQHNPDHPRANDARDGDLRANLDKNRCGRDARGYIDQRNREHEERELRCCLDYDRGYGPLGAVHRVIKLEERDRHDFGNRRRAQYKTDYGHLEGPIPNMDHQPRSQVMATAHSRGSAQVGDSGDDMAITAFPVLAPRL